MRPSHKDADEDEDGAIVFEEWLVSYAKPKPVWKNLLLMAANTLIIFLLLQARFRFSWRGQLLPCLRPLHGSSCVCTRQARVRHALPLRLERMGTSMSAVAALMAATPTPSRLRSPLWTSSSRRWWSAPSS